MKRPILLLIMMLSLVTLRVKAQNDGISQLLRANKDDAQKLLEAYADPLFKGFGTGLNTGWTNTAKTKGLLHFDLRITATGAFVPTADKSFDVTKLGLSNNVRPVPGSPTITPTIGGDKGMTPATMGIYTTVAGNQIEVDRFTMPKRITPIIPAPQIQLTVGLVHNTDVTLRLIPKTKISDDIGSTGMYGFGLKHNIMKDFAAGLIPFDLAVAAGYTRFNYELPLDVKPGTGKAPDAQSAQKSDFSNQRLDGHLSGFNAQVIVSKKLAVFTPFAAVAYNTSKTDVGLLGNYPVTTGPTTYTVFTNQFSVNKTSVNGMRADVGFQLDLAFFKFYASGSLGQYKSVNAGIGFGF
jgi:hypothetical protein